MSLTPSLWKTCRVIANSKRLDLFRVLDREGILTVSEIASRADMGLGICSLYLKNLQARGLLAATRKGIHVFYEIRPDPKVTQADGAVAALRGLIRQGLPNEKIARVFNAFRNPGAAGVVLALAGQSWRDSADLARKLDLTYRTLLRYRMALARAGFLEHDKDDRVRLCPNLAGPFRRLVALTSL